MSADFSNSSAPSHTKVDMDDNSLHETGNQGEISMYSSNVRSFSLTAGREEMMVQMPAASDNPHYVIVENDGSDISYKCDPVVLTKDCIYFRAKLRDDFPGGQRRKVVLSLDPDALDRTLNFLHGRDALSGLDDVPAKRLYTCVKVYQVAQKGLGIKSLSETMTEELANILRDRFGALWKDTETLGNAVEEMLKLSLGILFRQYFLSALSKRIKMVGPEHRETMIV